MKLSLKLRLFFILCALITQCLSAKSASPIEIGIAVRDVTPPEPIWLAGYAARNRPSEKIDTPLLAQAIAIKSGAEKPVVLVSLDNCEFSREFIQPVVRTLDQKHPLGAGRVMIVCSHTHSAPVLESTLSTMYDLPPKDQERVH